MNFYQAESPFVSFKSHFFELSGFEEKEIENPQLWHEKKLIYAKWSVIFISLFMAACRPIAATVIRESL